MAQSPKSLPLLQKVKRCVNREDITTIGALGPLLCSLSYSLGAGGSHREATRIVYHITFYFNILCHIKLYYIILYYIILYYILSYVYCILYIVYYILYIIYYILYIILYYTILYYIIL